jgi:type VI secretion system secreted protein Hcp
MGSAVHAQAAYDFYMSVTGQTQGEIKSEVQNPLGDMPCQALVFSETSPRNAQTGQVTGRRQYQPVTITREWDAASPKLFQALVTNENFTDVTFKFPHDDTTGKTTLVATIHLTNAHIASLRYFVAAPGATESTGHLMEEISFSFQKIDVTGANGGITASDDWDASVAGGGTGGTATGTTGGTPRRTGPVRTSPQGSTTPQ